MSEQTEATTQTTEQTDSTQATPASEKQERTIPYSRFEEVVQEKNSFKTRLAEVEKALAEGNKLKEELAKERQQREAAELIALRIRVAALKGLPAEAADRLQGSNEAELTADADKLLSLGLGRPKAPEIDASKTDGSAQTFTYDQLSDPAFYNANRDAILAALSEGRVR